MLIGKRGLYEHIFGAYKIGGLIFNALKLQKNGFSLFKIDQILDSGYSPKDLLVFTKSR